ncbi:MAG: hypothetical protein BWZ06_01196 [Bacteroidetes bacterium ADurb.BinA261]|jgi:hypothetical protein|nr:MAG: hypothetical protein BWZ06_01196 [Bacteroidetes bacterium ADurb.BinA261]
MKRKSNFFINNKQYKFDLILKFQLITNLINICSFIAKLIINFFFVTSGS